MVIFNGTENLCQKKKKQNELALVMMSVCGLRCSMKEVIRKILLQWNSLNLLILFSGFVLRWRSKNCDIFINQKTFLHCWRRFVENSSCGYTWHWLILFWVWFVNTSSLNLKNKIRKEDYYDHWFIGSIKGQWGL